MEALFAALLPILVAALTRYVTEGLQSLIAVMDKLPAIVKQIVVVAIAFLLTHLSLALGIPLPESLDGLTPEVVSSILSALGAMGWHQLAKGKKLSSDPQPG